MNSINVICLDEPALYELIETVLSELRPENEKTRQKWVTPKQAQEYLNVGRTKLQELRDLRKVKYSQPSRKSILYDIDSLDSYLEENVKKTF